MASPSRAASPGGGGSNNDHEGPPAPVGPLLATATSYPPDFVPSTAEMAPLTRALKSRKSALQAKVQQEEQEKANLANNPGLPPRVIELRSSSGSTSKAGGSSSQAPPDRRRSLSARSASPASSAKGRSQTKVKVKREAVAGPSSAVAATPPPRSQDDSTRTPRIPQSAPDADSMDVDDAPPSRPSRTYAKAKGRHRQGGQDGNAAMSDDGSNSVASEDGRVRSPSSDGQEDDSDEGAPGSTSSAPRRPTRPLPARSSRQTPGGSTPARPLNIRLKLNPTRAPSGIAALGAAHRPTGVHPDGLPILAGGLGAAASGSAPPFNWSLPDEPTSIIPPKPVSRPPKPYLTNPADVDEDFTATDWKERERQRDREEAVLSTNSASASPAPGQTHLHKDVPGGAIGSAAANRVRSQNQQQVTHQNFQAYVDSWFKPVLPEDIAWLENELKRADPEEVPLPPLGRHYKEVWAEEDTATHFSGYPHSGEAAASASSVQAPSSSAVASEVAPFDPRTLSDEHAYGTAPNEAKGGPMSERILAMLLPAAGGSSQAGDGEHVNGSGNGAGPSTNGASAKPPAVPSIPRAPPPQDMAQYEARILEELRELDIMPPEGSIDWANAEDDAISAAIRKVEHLSRQNAKANKKRLARVRQVAIDKVAHNEYMHYKLHLEKLIEQGWTKRQTVLKRALSKKKSQKGGGSSGTESTAGPTADQNSSIPGGVANTSAGQEALQSSSSSSGTTTPHAHAHDPDGNYLGVPPLPESLVQAMKDRAILVNGFEPMWRKMPHSRRIPLPHDSLFAGLDISDDEGEGGGGGGEGDKEAATV